MSDLVYDGSRLWARIEWKVKGGATIDGSKIMLVDSGAPYTGISASNLDPNLNLVGLTTVAILGCVGDGMVIDGGEMNIDIDGHGATCSRPVIYSPCFEGVEILGLDQMVELGIIQGFSIAGSPPPIGMTLPPFPLTSGDVGAIIVSLATVRPGTYPTPVTPPPGLFALTGTVLPKAGYLASNWRFEGGWPDVVRPGAVFPLELATSFDDARAFMAASLEIPFAFELEAGDPSWIIHQPQRDSSHAASLKLRAPDNEGDYYIQINVRTGEEDAKSETVELMGRIRVRDGEH